MRVIIAIFYRNEQCILVNWNILLTHGWTESKFISPGTECEASKDTIDKCHFWTVEWKPSPFQFCQRNWNSRTMCHSACSANRPNPLANMRANVVETFPKQTSQIFRHKTQWTMPPEQPFHWSDGAVGRVEWLSVDFRACVSTKRNDNIFFLPFKCQASTFHLSLSLSLSLYLWMLD